MGLVTLAIMPSPSSLLIPSLDDDDLLGLDRRRDLEDWREDFFAGISFGISDSASSIKSSAEIILTPTSSVSSSSSLSV